MKIYENKTWDEYYFWHSQGYFDCREGLDALDGLPEAYYAGYGSAYEAEQMQTKEGQN